MRRRQRIHQAIRSPATAVLALALLALQGNASQAQDREKPDDLSRLDSSNPIYTSIPGQFARTDVDSIIRLEKPEAVRTTRRALIRLVFGADSLPEGLSATQTQESIADPNWTGMMPLDRVDTLVHTMEHGIDSHMHYFHGKDPVSKLAIYHQGHIGGYIRGQEMIRSLLDAGFDVIALTMPLVKPNSTPLVNIDHLGLVQLDNHRWLRFLDRPLRFFFEPVLAAVNFGLGRKSYEEVAMVGFSGGGWTTTVYAAMDTRIRRSYSIAGTMPMYLRSSIEGIYKGQIGDMEQNDPDLLMVANYLEMYILGSLGEDRGQVQIMLKYDSSSATHGIKHRTFLGSVQRRLAGLGPGSFDVFVDSSSGRFHTMTSEAVKHVIRDLERPASPVVN